IWIEIQQELVDDPVGLVATLAHELCHLYVYERLELRKHLPLDHEFLTDLLTIALGFGFFSCESSFRYGTWTVGSGASSMGYLAQSGLSFALALWCALLDREVGPLLSHLGTNARSYFQQAQEFFEDHPDLVASVKAGRSDGLSPS